MASRYYILNLHGDLALTHHGGNRSPTVTEFESLPTQVWALGEEISDGARTISPMDDVSLYIAIDRQGYLIAAPSQFPVYWRPFLSDPGRSQNAYTISDRGTGIIWDLERAESGQAVMISPFSSPEKPRHALWRLIPAPDEE